MSIIIKKLKYIILTLILIIFILNIKIVINSTYEASLLFFKKVFITIFPFVILCDFLIYFNYHIFIKGIFGKIINKIFNIFKTNNIDFKQAFTSELSISFIVDDKYKQSFIELVGDEFNL